MRTGLLLDNVPIGQPVPQSSIDKLVAMGATACGTLWTAGTRHTREVYDRCEAVLDKPLYIVRVGGHRQTAEEWIQDAAAAVLELPRAVDEKGRAVLVCGNEPSLEGYVGDPEGYGRLYADVMALIPNAPLFACPSMGVEGWWAYLETALAYCQPTAICLNVYDYLISNVPEVIQTCGNVPCYIGEVNTLRPNRASWFQDVAWPTLQNAGVEASLIFIAGGQSNGDWDENYVISQEEALALRWVAPQEEPMPEDPRIQQLLDQYAIVTQALIDFRHGRFEGADGMDGRIVQLLGGLDKLPADWNPTYPPK